MLVVFIVDTTPSMCRRFRVATSNDTNGTVPTPSDSSSVPSIPPSSGDNEPDNASSFTLLDAAKHAVEYLMKVSHRRTTGLSCRVDQLPKHEFYCAEHTVLVALSKTAGKRPKRKIPACYNGGRVEMHQGNKHFKRSFHSQVTMRTWFISETALYSLAFGILLNIYLRR
jgi:hypothetical protein